MFEKVQLWSSQMQISDELYSHFVEYSNFHRMENEMFRGCVSRGSDFIVNGTKQIDCFNQCTVDVETGWKLVDLIKFYGSNTLDQSIAYWMFAFRNGIDANPFPFRARRLPFT